MRRVAVGMVLACLTASCVDEIELDVVATEPTPIIGGVEDTAHPEVPLLQMEGFLCTGTLVAENVVLTAAHCVENINRVNVTFGSRIGDPDGESVTGNWVIWHRYYNSSTIGAGLPYDIALVRLKDPAPAGITPMAMNLDPLPESIIGDSMLAVGFGNDNGEAGTGAGIKRRVMLPINTLSPLLIGMGDDYVNTCQGDSGGPGIYEFDGVEHVIGVTSTGPSGCVGNSHQTRVDAYRDDFIIPILDAWTGPCSFDGECVEEGCRTPDPDCDPCAVDGFCATGCDRLDLDCPVGGFAGDWCDDNDDCESRLCVEAHDDPRVKYCSAACDVGGSASEQCDAPLAQCGTFNGGPEACHYIGPSRGAQGWECATGADCRSGVCDPDNDICIEQCGGGLPECAEGYACESVGGGVKACTIPSGGCGCAAGGAGQGRELGGLLLLLGAVFFARRGRARRRHS